jgi:cysteine desulfurase
LRYLEKFGFEIVELPVDRYGRVDPEAVEASIDARTILVSVMLANNEVGTIEPVAEIARRAHAHKGVLVHTDAVQAAPYLDVDVAALDVDLLSLGAHKAEGPKGLGALYIRHGTRILAQQQGGSQERHRRAGTEDVAGAMGIAVALELAKRERADVGVHLRTLRERLRAALLDVDGVELTGHPTDRLPGLLSLIVAGADGPSIVLALDLAGIAISIGSACTSGSNDPSDVLKAMAYPEDEARGAVRLSLGRTTTDDEIDEAVGIVPEVLQAVRVGAAALAADPLGQGVLAGGLTPGSPA